MNSGHLAASNASVPALAGAPAFRDLGGRRTANGLHVRTGCVFRSCGLMELTETDVQVLRGTIRLKTIIDLRDASEVAKDGNGPLPGLQLSYRNLPLINLIANPPDRQGRLLDRYRLFLREGASSIAKVLEVCADRTAQPVVFHCTAGKDRTGIVAAILLKLLGVDAEEIVADYSSRRHELDWLMKFLARRGVQGAKLGEIHPDLLDCNPTTMREFLRILDAEYGGARTYLRAAGTDERLFARLEEVLLESRR